MNFTMMFKPAMLSMLTWSRSLAKLTFRPQNTNHKSALSRDVQLAYKKKHLGLERPERLLQAYNFVDGSTQCQVSKQSTPKKI